MSKFHASYGSALVLLSVIGIIIPMGTASRDLNEVVLLGTERPLTGTDRIATLRTTGSFLRYSLISSGEVCVLKKFTRVKPVHRCEDIPRQVCRDEFVLLRKRIVENCTESEEFCEAFHRTQKLSNQIVVCEPEFQVECLKAEGKSDRNPTESTIGHEEIEREEENAKEEWEWEEGEEDAASCEDCPLICHPRRIAFCKSIPQKVTLTERKQRCHGRIDEAFQTTKLCFTFEDGSGHCQSFRSPREMLRDCEQIEEMKVINSEVSSAPKLHCQEKMADEDYCHPSHCRVVTNKTRCVTDSLPKMVQLKEIVCEKCMEGRVKLRPVVETRRVCRDKVEHICLDIQEEEVTWRKWCRPLEDTLPEESRASSASYQIEIAPGLWLTTKNRTEATFYLRQQAQLEETYSLTTQQSTSFPPSPPPTSPSPSSSSSSSASSTSSASSASLSSITTTPLSVLANQANDLEPRSVSDEYEDHLETNDDTNEMGQNNSENKSNAENTKTLISEGNLAISMGTSTIGKPASDQEESSEEQKIEGGLLMMSWKAVATSGSDNAPISSGSFKRSPKPPGNPAPPAPAPPAPGIPPGIPPGILPVAPGPEDASLAAFSRAS
ncbi:hypothetical protein TCAL_15777 [Tigriopus californicus]|uniref:Uncharacterized protein n=1 Tax=Tigriopus californicus TaxID=6832 RepID=A0A553P8I0_TIGCA|nr:hypothetical protein TCAL_15777 [Tigriopus californicus]